MSIEEVYKAIQEAFEKSVGAVKATVENLLETVAKLFRIYKPMQYIPPKHRQMRYCWNKSRNWKRGWQ